MDGLRRAIDIRFEYHVWGVDWPVEVEQEYGFVRAIRRSDDKVKLRLAELAVQILPEVGNNAFAVLYLALAVGPFTQTLYMDVLHRPGALAGCDERVATSEIFFLVEANTADFTRL